MIFLIKLSPYSGNVRNMSRLHALEFHVRHIREDISCAIQIGWINHFVADVCNSERENDRIKFPTRLDTELSYGFVREWIMFRNQHDAQFRGNRVDERIGMRRYACDDIEEEWRG